MADPAAYLLDTSAILAHFRGEQGMDQVQSIFRLNDARIYISAVSIAEFARRLKDLGASADEARQACEAYVSLVTAVVPVDAAVAYDALDVSLDTPTRLPLADALIIACARSRGAVLVHRDKHMGPVPASVAAQMELTAADSA